MYITGLVKRLEHVCCRYRLAAFRPYLEAAGHRLDLVPWSGSLLNSWLARRQLTGSDVVVLQRLLLPSWQLSLIRQHSQYLVFDFDDALFLRDSYDARGLCSRRKLRRFVRTLRAADVVVAGNAFLAEEACRWVPARRVRTIPTCVDVDAYPCAEHQRERGLRFAWIGSASTLQGLERIAPLLNQLGQRVPGLSLKIICDRPMTLEHLPVHFRPWSSGTEAAELAASDIGITWLPDDAWSRGKCGLKVLQYMAAGLPVLANPVGVQAELVEHGATGFLVRSPGDWVQAVGTLASGSLRRSLGGRGRARVMGSFSLSQGAARWLDVLENLPQRSTLQVCRGT